jgi:hypothetical protein
VVESRAEIPKGMVNIGRASLFDAPAGYTQVPDPNAR